MTPETSMTPENSSAHGSPGGVGLSSAISEVASHIKESASDAMHSGTKLIQRGKVGAADGLANAASGLHASADDLPGGETVAKFAHGAADKLASSATYIRSNDLNDVVDDLKGLVKNNPIPSLVTAIAIGFILGRSMSRND